MARRDTVSLGPSPAGMPSRLREQRFLFGLTTDELGALSGNSGTQAAYWEAGHHLPDAHAIQAWAKAGLDTTYILTGIPSADVPILDLEDEAEADITPSYIDRLSCLTECLCVAAIGGTVLLAISNAAPVLFARMMQ